MMLNKYLDINPEVSEALASGKPVVALESTIISHGMPYPQNVETALNVEQIIRENGAVPATIAIIGGRLKAGLTPEEIAYFGKKDELVSIKSVDYLRDNKNVELTVLDSAGHFFIEDKDKEKIRKSLSKLIANAQK